MHLRAGILALIVLFLQNILHAQVIINSLKLGNPKEWLAYSFPLVHSSNKQVANKINTYLQSEILNNETVLTDTNEVFENSRYISTDSFTQSGHSMISYEVELNNSRLLSLVFEMESTGAYSENYQRHYSFNTQTGELIMAKDLFTPSGIELIKQRLIKERKQKVAKWIKELKADNDGDIKQDSAWINETLANCNENAEEDNFTITKTTIVFNKGYCFPHVARPYDTNLDIGMTYKEIEKYLSPEGKKLFFQKN